MRLKTFVKRPAFSQEVVAERSGGALSRMGHVTEEDQDGHQRAHQDVNEAEAHIAAGGANGLRMGLQPVGDGGLEIVGVGQHLGNDLFAVSAEPGARRIEDVRHLIHHVGQAAGAVAHDRNTESDKARENECRDCEDEEKSQRSRGLPGEPPGERAADEVENQIERQPGDESGDEVFKKDEEHQSADQQPGRDLGIRRSFFRLDRSRFDRRFDPDRNQRFRAHQCSIVTVCAALCFVLLHWSRAQRAERRGQVIGVRAALRPLRPALFVSENPGSARRRCLPASRIFLPSLSTGRRCSGGFLRR